MGGLDPAKILIVLLLAVIILGPERLPKVARQLGSIWRELLRLRDRLEAEVRSAMPDLDLPDIPLPKRGIAGYLSGMMVSSTSGAEAAEAATASEGAGMTTPLLGATAPGATDLLDPAGRNGTERRSSRSPRGTAEWTTSSDVVAEPSELPAGWHAVGASGPGYASGSVLAPVPSSVASGPLGIEAPVSFDEPSWN